jgi:dolichol-phosphate mannosyltransferase
MNYNALNQREKSKLSIVMPVYNEGVRVIPVVTTLAFTIKFPFELVVVYDSEDDPTIKVLQGFSDLFPAIKLVKNENPGVIGAVKTGFDNSESEYSLVWVSYAVDPFGLVNEMYKLAEGGCDLVSGNRFNKIKRVSRGTPIKKILSRGGNYLLNRLIGIPLGDITTSCKLYSKKFLKENPIETKTAGGWALSTELAVKAAIKGYKLGDVEFLPQNVNLIQGISNFKVFIQIDQYLKWLLLGFKNRKIIKKNYSTK